MWEKERLQEEKNVQFSAAQRCAAQLSSASLSSLALSTSQHHPPSRTPHPAPATMSAFRATSLALGVFARRAALPATRVVRSLPPASSSLLVLGSARQLSLWSQQPKPAVEQAKDTATSVSESAKDATSSASQSAHDAAASASQAASDAATTASQAVSSAADGVASLADKVDVAATASATAAGVQPGELASLGLAHWSSPPGWITQLLDFVGTSSHLPWWGTIIVTTVLLRVIIAPVNIAGQKNAIRLSNISPKMKQLMDDVKHHKAAGDPASMQRAVMEVQTLMRDNNANPFKSFTPLLVQFPLMFSFFLALERIAKSGSLSFAQGGPWWTPDLTIPDPTYVLPLLSTAATLAVAELGFKFGTNGGSSDQSQAKMVKWVFRGAMPLIAWFSTTFPSGVLVYWAATNIWSLAQLLLLQIPAVRTLAKFPKRIQHPPSPYATKKPSFLDSIKRQAAERAGPVARPVTPRQPPSRSKAVDEILADKQAAPAAAASLEENARRRDRVLRAQKRRQNS